MKLIFAYLIVYSWLGFVHPFHISLTEIRQNNQTRKLEIAQKIFWDDLEIGLKGFHKVEINFLNPKDRTKLTAQVESYLLSQQEIWLDGKKANLTLLGFEIEGDAAWFYFESAPINWKNKIEVRNSVLIQDFPDQQNIIQIYPKGKSMKNMLLRKGKERESLNFM
jgi:hypothetical protein